MKILVINSGSSSLKYTLFDMDDESVIFSGMIDRLGLGGSVHSYGYGGQAAVKEEMEISDHGSALDTILHTIVQGPVDSLDRISAVAHRVGHGGKYYEAAPITPEVMSEIRRMTPMIPLHHPAMITEIEECTSRMPNALHVAVFDTWFHSTIPLEAAIYGIPYRYYEEKGYRRTGFHGNSHAYVAGKAAEYLGRPLSDLKIISCHLGNGAGVCAIDGGKSVDTSLGMTALEGLIMGTRSGDVDPGLISVIMEEDSLSPKDLSRMLYKESGILGISGVSPDFRDVETAAEKGDERAELAINAFCHRIKKYVGAMLMVLGGCDVLIFCAGIGRNSPRVREGVLKHAAGLGFAIDERKNYDMLPTAKDPVTDISSPESRVRILVVKTFEELMMARQCAQVVDSHRR